MRYVTKPVYIDPFHMRYVTKPVYVDAFQMTRKARETGPIDWPEWLQFRFDNTQARSKGSASLYVNSNGDMLIDTPLGQLVSYDDWIVLRNDETMRMFQPDEFDRTYRAYNRVSSNSGYLNACAVYADKQGNSHAKK